MVLTLDLYFRLPFGRLVRTNPDIIELANLIGRTNSAVALRLVNYAACDPVIVESGRTGMVGGYSTCKPIWDEYIEQKEKLFYEAQEIKARLLKSTVEKVLHIQESELKGLDRLAYVKQRINQQAFRTMVLNYYEQRCAITGINIPELLVASHIIPWAENPEERLNPENGICLSALYDKAFDKGYISIDNQYRVILSDTLKQYRNESFFEKHFTAIEGAKIHLPDYHRPSKLFLEWHRDVIFKR